MSPEQRLRFRQEHSGPLMKGLHEWMEAQLAEHKTEPNSGLGKAISYLLKDTPSERPIEPEPDTGELQSVARVGGLHHRYIWKTAA
jgi:hypothetical protein